MWEWFNAHFGAGDAAPPTDPIDPNAPVFHARTDCPNPWPGLIVAFVLGAILFHGKRR